MTDLAPRLLFVPVSGEFGMGEYARTLAIAQAAERRWPGASVHFVLSRAAPYAVTVPYPATLLAASPTFHSGAVVALIEQWRPDVVIFDNAGRTAQLRAAHRRGAGVVYISARRRQRRKAFRLRWMRVIDEHWIAYPEFVAGALSVLERCKLRWLRRPAVRYLDVLLTPGTAAHGSVPARIGVAADGYVLVVPGGGTGHPGASDAVARFLAVARGLAGAGVATVFVGDAGAGTIAVGAGHADAVAPPLYSPGSLPQSDLAELMRGARLIIVNGGSTLLQALACGKPCIAVPIAGDQHERIRRCARAGAALAAPLDPAAILRAATGLWRDEGARGSLAAAALALGLADGCEVALQALADLLARRRHGAPRVPAVKEH